MEGRRRTLAACLALALAAAGCGATPAAGERLVLEGTLVLRGNEPRTEYVLLRPGGEQWVLEEAPDATARPLQNRTVRVTGVVTRAPGAGLRLPALRVSQLRQVP